MTLASSRGRRKYINKRKLYVGKSLWKELSDSLSDNIFVPVDTNLIRDNVSSDNNQDIMKAVKDKNIKLGRLLRQLFMPA